MDLPRIGKPAPTFKEKAVLANKVYDVSSNDYKDKYLIILFFPMDFAYVCPTELITFSEHLEDFAKLNTSIIGCSTDSHLTHLHWLAIAQKDGGICGLRIPLVADKTMTIARKYGILNEDEGIPYRAMFIIDDKGILRQITVNDRPVGRNVFEARRLIKTIQQAEKLRKTTSSTGFVEVSPEIIAKSRSMACVERAINRDLTE